ncbi:MAG: hypothetical protein P9M11_09665 [Candidatus Tenebribacter burtonii]|jgi:hypothetical protein|nr:hypothetical protein [Candidatus Tenebribacter burtonii]
MIDTIRIYSDEQDIINSFDINCLEINQETVKQDKPTVISGMIGNLKVYYSTSRLTIMGSLTKYYFGNNIQMLTRQEINKAIKKLEQRLDFSLDNFRISRLDIAANFEMNYSLSSYLDCLIEAKQYDPVIRKNSKDFINNLKTIKFYDKVEESKKDKDSKELILINGLSNKYILRYELQIKKRLKDVLKQIHYVKDLKDDKFIQKLLNLWKKEFHKIKKAKKVLNFEEVKTNSKKEIMEYFALSYMELYGTDKSIKLFKKLEQSSQIGRNIYYSLKRKIDDKKNKFTYTDKYETELNNKIDEFSKCYINNQTSELNSFITHLIDK